jgi:RecA/RadA recombinase
MSDLMKRLKKNSRLDSEVITKSKYHGKSEFTVTDTPMLNVALSGDIDGGLQKGILTLAGPSKHFKTAFSLKLASEFMKKYPESIMLFYDSEFGSPSSYFEMAGIDMERVLHTPVKNLEEFKFDIINQLENLTDSDQIIIVVDSIGNLASKKELEDALAEKSSADMTRAKVLKGIFRMITPFINMKFIPFIGIAHTYDTQEMYSKKVVSGGTGLYYSSDDIWILGRRQNKVGTEILGYDFVINIEKSRTVKEKSIIPISVTWEGGIDKYSGLLDVALAGDFVVKPSNGWYSKVDPKTGEIEDKKYRAKELDGDFWKDILEYQEFKDFVKDVYQMNRTSLVDMSEQIEVVDDNVVFDNTEEGE